MQQLPTTNGTVGGEAHLAPPEATGRCLRSDAGTAEPVAEDGSTLVTVRLFARARDLVGSAEVTVSLPHEARVSDLRVALQTAYPALQPLASRLLIAVNSDYAADQQIIPAAAEVACFPPVSGG